MIELTNKTMKRGAIDAAGRIYAAAVALEIYWPDDKKAQAAARDLRRRSEALRAHASE